MSEERIKWHKSPIEKETLIELTQHSDAAGIKQAGGFLLIYIINTALALYLFKQQLWIPMVAVCYLHSCFLGFMGMGAAVHELSHGTPFKTRGLNEFFYNLFSFLTWNNPVHFRYSHQKHHHLTVYRGRDKEVILAPIALSPLVFLRWLTFDYKWFWKIMKPNVAHFFGHGEVDFFFWDPLFEKGDQKRGQMIRWARFMMLAHLALLAVFIYFKLWVLIYTVTVASFFATFLTQSCGSLQHSGLRPDVPDWRLSCHTLRLHPVVSFLYWQMNYHIEHHMFAAVPFFNLPRLHEALKPDLPNNFASGLLTGLKKLLAVQKEQHKSPGYCFEPEFPATALPPKYTE
jgi:fatty acid desaturase